MAKTDLETLVVRMEAQMRAFENELKKGRQVADRETKAIEKRFSEANAKLAAFGRGLNVEQQLSGFASRLGPVGSGLAALGPAGLAASAAIGLLGGAFGFATMAAAETERVTRRLEAVLRVTGHAAGLSAADIDRFAVSIERTTGTAADEVKSAAAALATFTSIGGNEFKQILALANDAMAVFGGNLREWSDKFARAVDDPIQGFSALKKAGFSLTDSQLELAKAMQRVGDVTGYQNFVIKSLRDQIGGAAGAQSQGLTGAFTKATQAVSAFFQELSNRSGTGTAIGWVLESIARGAERLTDAMSRMPTSARITRVGEEILSLDTKIHKLEDRARGSSTFAFAYGGYIESLKKQKALLENELAELNKEFGRETDQRAELAASERAAKVATATEKVKESIAELDKNLKGFETNSEKLVRFRAEYRQTMEEIAKSREMGLVDPKVLDERAEKAKRLLDVQIAQTQKLIEAEARRDAKRDGFQQSIDAVSKRIALMQAEVDTIDDTTAARERAKVVAELETAAIRSNEAARKSNTAVTAEQRAEIEKYADKMLSVAQAAEDARSPLASFVREGRDLNKNFQDAAVSGLRSFEDVLLSIGDRTTTVSEKFRAMAESILKDMTRMLIRASVSNLLNGVFGGYSMGDYRVPVAGVNFSGGGYTGPGGKHEPAGVVHKGEYVFSAPAVNRIGVSRLDSLHRGYVNGGYVGSSGSQTGFKVEIVNQSSDRVNARPGGSRQDGGVNIQRIIIEAVAGDIAGSGLIGGTLERRYGLDPTRGMT